MLSIKNQVLTGANNRPILADLFLPNHATNLPCPIVLYIHGFNGFKDWGNFELIAARFVAQGIAVASFNTSHNGTNIHSPSDFVDLSAYANNNISKELYDTQMMLQWIVKQSSIYTWIDISRIILLGHSRGGGIALITAAEQKIVKACITWAAVGACTTPYTHFSASQIQTWKELGVMYYDNKRTKQQMPINYQLYEDYLVNQLRFDLHEIVKKFKKPILFCHGVQDEAVPVSVAENYHALLPSSSLFVVDSDHVFGRKHPYQLTELPLATINVIDRCINFIRHFM